MATQMCIPKHNGCSASLALKLYLQQLTYSKITVMRIRSFSLRAVFMLIGQRAVTNGLDFSPSVTRTEGESDIALLERLFMIC